MDLFNVMFAGSKFTDSENKVMTLNNHDLKSTIKTASTESYIMYI